MGWKEDLEAELAAEGQKLRDAGVQEVAPPEQAEAEADRLQAEEQRLGNIEQVAQSDEVMAEGRTLRDAGVEYQGEADLNDVLQTVEDEGAPEVETADQPEPEPEPEQEASAEERDPWQPEGVSNEDWQAYQQDMAEMEAARTPEEIDAEQWAMANYYEAEQAAQAEADITEPSTDTPEVTEPEAETAEVTEPEADAPEVMELEGPEDDGFEAWADSKAPAAPEQGQELEQEQPEQAEPQQMEMDLDDR